ncbi:MAG: hypothetical protein ACF8PN_01065 [Phycisphaerales bacterium]
MKGALFRWGAMALGLFLMYQSVKTWWNHTPLDDTPDTVTIDELSRAASSLTPRYVSVHASLDTDHRVYRTGMSRPAYSTIPPDVVVDLSAPDAPSLNDLDELVGALVSIDSTVNPMATGYIETVEVYEGESIEEGRVTAQKYLGPIIGGDNRLFAISPTYSGNGEDQAVAWMSTGSMRGRLSRFNDLSSNASNVGESPGTIANWVREWGCPINPSDAYVIVTENQEAKSPSTWFTPVAGSNFTTWVEVTASRENEIRSSGVITGIVKSWDGSRVEGWGEALGVSLPGQVATITDETAAQYNAGMAAMFKGGFMFGLFCFAFGAGTTFLLHKIRGHNKRKTQEAFGAAYGVNDYRNAA